MVDFSIDGDEPVFLERPGRGTQYVQKRSWICEDESGIRIKIREIATVKDVYAANYGPPLTVTTEIKLVTDGGQPAMSDDPSYTMFRVMTRDGVRLFVVQESH